MIVRAVPVPLSQNIGKWDSGTRDSKTSSTPQPVCDKCVIVTKGTKGTIGTKGMARTFLLIATSLRSLRSFRSLRSSELWEIPALPSE